MEIVEEILAEAGIEAIELVFPNLGSTALLDGVSGLPLDAPEEAMEQDAPEGTDESLKDIRALHESLKAKWEALVSRKAEAEFWFNMAAAGSALSPNMELLMSRSSKLGKVKGALEEINSVLMSWIFDPVNVAKTPPRNHGDQGAEAFAARSAEHLHGYLCLGCPGLLLVS